MMERGRHKRLKTGQQPGDLLRKVKVRMKHSQKVWQVMSEGRWSFKRTVETNSR